MSEPIIFVNGVQFTEAQAMAVRVAVTSFHAHDAREPSLGDIGKLYQARLGEVLHVMLPPVNGAGSALVVESLSPVLKVTTYSTKGLRRADGKPFQPAGPTIRTCWRCNPAHKHLKIARSSGSGFSSSSNRSIICSRHDSSS